MIPIERVDKVREILNDKKFVTIDELCEKLFVSKATIRRDLVELEAKNIIIRHRGGASIKNISTTENNYMLRKEEREREKRVIADMASTFIEDGFSLFLDSSSTVNHIIPFLDSFKNLIIITNGINNALSLSSFSNVQTIFVGGELLHGSLSTTGVIANDCISHYIVDLCFTSCRGLDEDSVYEANEKQALVKNKMITNAKKNILLCDSSKFNKVFFYKLSDISKYDYIITEKYPHQTTKDNIEMLGPIFIEG